MRTTRFFRLVWRTNALVILGAGLLALVLLAYGVVQLVSSSSRMRPPDDPVRVEQEETKERLSLGNGEAVRGTEYVLVALQSFDVQNGREYSSAPSRVVRNYAFIGPDGAPRWIYPHNRFVITGVTQFASEEGKGDGQPARAVMLETAQRDTNGDKRISEQDEGVVALVKPNGDGYKEILSGVARIVSTTVKGDAILFVYETEAGAFVATVSLQDFSVKSKRPLPMPGAARSSS